MPTTTVSRLTAEELHDLIDRVHAGDKDAERQVVLANLGLVNLAASRYKKWALSQYVDFEDIWQEGVLALYRSLHSYDYDKGTFSTYSYPAIRGAMVDYVLANCWQINTRYHRKIEKLLAQTRSELKKEYKREPTLVEISRFSHLSLRRVKNQSVPSIRLLRLDQAAYDKLDQGIEPQFEEAWLLEELSEALDKLEDASLLEAQIVRMYYGFTQEDGSPATKRSIEDSLNVSQNKISKALYRVPPRLKAYMACK